MSAPASRPRPRPSPAPAALGAPRHKAHSPAAKVAATGRPLHSRDAKGCAVDRSGLSTHAPVCYLSRRHLSAAPLHVISASTRVQPCSAFEPHNDSLAAASCFCRSLCPLLSVFLTQGYEVARLWLMLQGPPAPPTPVRYDAGEGGRYGVRLRYV